MPGCLAHLGRMAVERTAGRPDLERRLHGGFQTFANRDIQRQILVRPVRVGLPFFGAAAHRAELEHVELAAVATHARLAKEDQAKTLQRIGEQGAHDFYDGELANKLVTAVSAAGGKFSFRDLRDYKPVWRAPVRIAFRGVDIYTVAPPAAGGNLPTWRSAERANTQ